MGSSNPGSSPIPARSKDSSRSPHRPTSALAAPSTITVHAPDKLIASQGATTVRLVANQQYFGFEARVFRAGAERVLARMAAQGPQQTRIDFRNLGADFHLDAAASWTLLSALLAGGLLLLFERSSTSSSRSGAPQVVLAPAPAEASAKEVKQFCGA